MDAAGFLRDLEAKPSALRALADRLGDEVRWPIDHAEGGGRVFLTGMGSSWFAADTVARRLRRAGITAMADLASVEANLPPADDLTVVGITASGTTIETIDAMGRHLGRSRTVGLTNRAADAGVDLPADHTVPLLAGVEEGGVACRSYVHTLVALLQLERQLTGGLADLPDLVCRAADAAEHLLATRADWLPALGEVLGGPHGTWLLAPAERLGNALQGSLMLREGPRRAADGCETGDWSHVDVYLTKTLDYRALVFTGSRFDGAAAQWMRDRGSRFAVVGPPTLAGAELIVRHPDDTDPLVRLLTEVLVPELLAAHWWAGR